MVPPSSEVTITITTLLSDNLVNPYQLIQRLLQPADNNEFRKSIVIAFFVL